jgi:hypothetical protein
MSQRIRYEKLKKHPQIFLRLSGLHLEEFEIIKCKIKSLWETQAMRQHPAGRPRELVNLEDQLLCLLIYYRTYITQEFLGYLFNLHNSNVCRLFKKLEPLLAKKITIKKDRTLTAEKILEILVDVTECPVQRPKRRKVAGKRTPKNQQKCYYSGKKKRHTIKHEIVIDGGGRILSVSNPIFGKRHDFRIRKEGRPLPKSEAKIVDSGYQGLQKLVSGVMLPFKGTKKKPLTVEQKLHNTALARRRIKVENKIREIKIFKIMSDVYRNFTRKHGLRMNIIAAIVNLKNNFATA